MFQKILIPIIFFVAQFIIAWYGFFTGKLSSKGNIFGFEYDSFLVRSFVTQVKYIWILILINVLFTIGFHLGFREYKQFLILASLWIASGPLALLLFNILFSKEKIDLPIVFGVLFIAIGAIGIVAHKEIVQFLK
ncbi:hypothetical protein HYV57_01175 [Candidatus Peregrinibacteria bacterium]|nr:hypothetical protein [Candidatus Peregrinibacteria bacterium]